MPSGSMATNRVDSIVGQDSGVGGSLSALGGLRLLLSQRVCGQLVGRRSLIDSKKLMAGAEFEWDRAYVWVTISSSKYFVACG